MASRAQFVHAVVTFGHKALFGFHTAVRDFLPEGDYVSQAVGLGPTTLWNRVLGVSARETADIGPQC